MRLSPFLMIVSLLAIVFGLGFLFVPAAMLALYGVEANPGSILMSRFFAGALMQLGATLFLARPVEDPIARRAILLGGLIGSIVGLAVAVAAVISGVVNGLGWSTVAIYGLLLLGFGSLVAVRPPAAVLR
jgi:hypothetical protein